MRQLVEIKGFLLSGQTLVNRALSPGTPPSVTLTRVLVAVVCLSGCMLALFFKDLTALYSIMLNLFLIIGPVVFAILFKRGSALSINVTLIAATLLLVHFAISDLLFETSHLLGVEVLVLAAVTSSNLFVKGKVLSHES